MKPITAEQYFAGKPHSKTHDANARALLLSVNALLAYCETNYRTLLRTCPNTGTLISGSKGGSGDGGFRLSTATTGASLSSHKEARGIDIFDPVNEIDELLDVHPELLVKFNLYRETPNATKTWCHLTTRTPNSGNRTFEI